MKDDEFLDQVRGAYRAEPVNAGRFDSRLAARIAEPARRGWMWALGGLAAAAAIAFVVWRPTSAPVNDGGAPPSVAIVSAAPVPQADPGQDEWIAALEFDDTVDDGLGGLPDDYAELADMLEL